MNCVYVLYVMFMSTLCFLCGWISFSFFFRLVYLEIIFWDVYSCVSTDSALQ